MRIVNSASRHNRANMLKDAVPVPKDRAGLLQVTGPARDRGCVVRDELEIPAITTEERQAGAKVGVYKRPAAKNGKGK